MHGASARRWPRGLPGVAARSGSRWCPSKVPIFAAAKAVLGDVGRRERARVGRNKPFFFPTHPPPPAILMAAPVTLMKLNALLGSLTRARTHRSRLPHAGRAEPRQRRAHHTSSWCISNGVSPARRSAPVIGETLGLVLGLAIVVRLGDNPLRVRAAALLDRIALRRMLAVNGDIMIRTIALMTAFLVFQALGARVGRRDARGERGCCTTSSSIGGLFSLRRPYATKRGGGAPAARPNGAKRPPRAFRPPRRRGIRGPVGARPSPSC